MGKRAGTRFPVFISALSGTRIHATERESAQEREIMNEGLFLIVIVAGWFVLNRFILPRLGVRT